MPFCELYTLPFGCFPDYKRMKRLLIARRILSIRIMVIRIA